MGSDSSARRKTKEEKAIGGGNVLSGVCPVVHEKELNVAGVLDEECLVAGGHHVAGLLVATVTDLYPQTIIYQHPSITRPVKPPLGEFGVVWSIFRIRTLGIAACPLKRLRTRLSIPLGLRHEGSTHIKVSD